MSDHKHALTPVQRAALHTMRRATTITPHGRVLAGTVRALERRGLVRGWAIRAEPGKPTVMEWALTEAGYNALADEQEEA